MEPEGVLVGPGRALLLGVRVHQGGVQVHQQQLAVGVRAGLLLLILVVFAVSVLYLDAFRNQLQDERIGQIVREADRRRLELNPKLDGFDASCFDGVYVTGNPIRGIRNYGMNFPSAGKFPEPEITR